MCECHELPLGGAFHKLCIVVPAYSEATEFVADWLNVTELLVVQTHFKIGGKMKNCDFTFMRTEWSSGLVYKNAEIVRRAETMKYRNTGFPFVSNTDFSWV